jgi:hypothetical protein
MALCPLKTRGLGFSFLHSCRVSGLPFALQKNIADCKTVTQIQVQAKSEAASGSNGSNASESPGSAEPSLLAKRTCAGFTQLTASPKEKQRQKPQWRSEHSDAATSIAALHTDRAATEDR